MIDSKPVFYEHWSRKGINKLKDILSESKDIINKTQIENKFNIAVRQMEYNSLVHAIPSNWKKSIVNINVEVTKPENQLFCNGKMHNIDQIVKIRTNF